MLSTNDVDIAPNWTVEHHGQRAVCGRADGRLLMMIHKCSVSVNTMFTINVEGNIISIAQHVK